jgi:hypothetical protein
MKERKTAASVIMQDCGFFIFNGWKGDYVEGLNGGMIRVKEHNSESMV